MASEMIFLTGHVKWTKADMPDPKYGKYTVDFFPDKPSWSVYKKAGFTLKEREDKETGDRYVKFSRDPDKLFPGQPEKPVKLIRDGDLEDGRPNYVPFEGKIGNGSFVTIKVQVYEGSKGVGHRWEAIAVEDLVPYEGQSQEDLPF